MLTKLKEKVQRWLVFEARLAHNMGLTPHMVSVIGVFFALLSAVAYWKWQLNHFLSFLAPLLLLTSGFFDALDGTIARISGEVTILGGFLDSLLDRYADAAILCGIIIGGLCDPFWGIIALIGSLLVSYTRARAEAAGIQMESVGFAERAERLIILAVASFLNIAWSESLSWGVFFLALITNVTVLQRAYYFYNHSEKKKMPHPKVQ